MSLNANGIEVNGAFTSISASASAKWSPNVPDEGDWRKKEIKREIRLAIHFFSPRSVRFIVVKNAFMAA